MAGFDIIVLLILIVAIFVTVCVVSLGSDYTDSKINNILNESFTDSDAQDFHNYSELKSEVKRMPNTFNDPVQEEAVTGNKDPYSYKSRIDFGTTSPRIPVSCSNSSINERYLYNPHQLLASSVPCSFDNYQTAENYYKMIRGINMYKVDGSVKGHNYADYSDYVDPLNMNPRILAQNTKGLPPYENAYKNLPAGIGYAFENSPALVAQLGGPVVAMP